MPCAGTSGVRRRHRPAAGPDRGQDFLSHIYKDIRLYASGYRSRRLIFCIMYLRFDSQVDGVNRNEGGGRHRSGNSRKNDKQKRQHPKNGGWRCEKNSYNICEPDTIVPVHKQMETG